MDLEKIKTLLDYVGRSRVAEMRVTQDGTTVVIRNAPAPDSEAAIRHDRDTVAGPGSPVPIATPGEPDGLVRAPVSGLVHKSASPGAPALVQLGDQVQAGQGLCVLEAMKVFTTLPAPRSGAIVRVLFKDGQEVAAGDPLVEIV